MNHQPLVSVIIPNYNYSKTLVKCFEALLRQSYKNTEIIFVDDGSMDNSVEIASKYPCEVIKSENRGVSAARNIGSRAANGDILFFLDSDIALFDDAIENTIFEFQQDISLGCVCGIYAKEPLYDDSLIEQYRILQGHYWRKSSEGYVTAAFVSLGAIKKTVFNEIGGFNEKLTNCEDLEIGHRINQKYNLLLTCKVVGYHDDEYQLKTLSGKMFERARQRIPFYFHRKKLSKGFETPQRAFGLLFAGLSCFMLPIAIFNSFALVGFLGSVLIFLLCDFGQYKFVLKEKGFVFTLFFIGAHWIISVVSFWGFVKGVFDFCLNKKFRDNYKIEVK